MTTPLTATTVTEMPETGSGRTATSPYRAYCDGQIWRLSFGTAAESRTAEQNLRNLARRMKLRVTIRSRVEMDARGTEVHVLYVQTSPRE